MVDTGMRRDQLIALMVAERDAELHGRGPVEVIRWPDDEDHANKTVELIARVSTGPEVVVEHTRIESFPEQIADRLVLHEYFPSGGPQIAGRYDAGKFGLSIIPGAVRELTRRQRRPVGPVITAWVAENLDQVPWPHTRSEPTYLLGSHHELPFNWALWRWGSDDTRVVGPLADVVLFWPTQPPGLENLRVLRLDQAVRDKVPKLLAATGGQRRSVLVLEDRDPDMSAPLLVSRALKAAVGDHPLPDVVYIILTRGHDPILGVLYEEGQWAHEHDEFQWESFSVPRCAELNALHVPWA